MIRLPLLTLIVAALLSASAAGQVIGDRATLQGLLGGGGTLHDFEAYNVAIGSADVLDVGFLDENTIANGQGPGLVSDGATYSTAQNFLQWNGDTYFGIPTRTLLSNSGDSTLYLNFDTPVQAFGFDLYTFSGYPDTTLVEVYDPAGAVLYTSAGISVPGTAGVFFGYQAPAIGGVMVQSQAFGWSTIIDDHLFGNIGGPNLRVTGLVAGGTATLTISGATAGGAAGVAYSLTGGGPTTTSVGGCGSVSVALSAPLRILPPMVADPAGNAVWTANVPAGTTGVAVWIQGMDVAACALTNGVAAVIG